MTLSDSLDSLPEELSSAAPTRPSLLAGRSNRPLDDRQIRAVAETFAGLDYHAPIRYEENSPTSFRVEEDELEGRVGVIVYGRDIYPGTSLVDPNSALSMQAAAAHELSHYYRWRDQTHLPAIEHEHLDEALTSLDAAVRFTSLTAHEVKQLILDAIQRVQMFYHIVQQEIAPEEPNDPSD